MKLYLNQLNQDLKKNLRPVYLLAGDEPLQLMEAGDSILRVAKAAGYSEKEVHHIDRGFDWGELYQAANCMSLFAEKKIIDLRFSSCKPGDKGSKALVEYCKSISDSNILILRMPKLEKAVQNSKWFKTLDQAGAVIQVWPIEHDKLPAWVQQRAKLRGLTFSPEAVKLLAEKVEGNLLAAAQEIEKLQLNKNKKIDADALIDTVAEAAKFDVFKLTDAVLSGKPKRSAKILLGLKSSGEEPVLVLWALTNEIRTLIKVSGKLSTGKPITAIFKEERIWDKKQPLVKAALQRLRGPQLSICLRQAIETDRMIKGMSHGNAWDRLMDLSLSLSGKTILKG